MIYIISFTMQKVLNYALVALVVLASLGAIGVIIVNQRAVDEAVPCTKEARMCPDGSSVGRMGPSCEFAPCPGTGNAQISPEAQAAIDAKRDLITITSPRPGSHITSPLTITGEARGLWFFEGNFPISLVDGKGRKMATGIAEAKGEWMTQEFVPFTATLRFIVDEKTTPTGTLILRKDNPSDLPENENSLEIPIQF